MTGRQLRHLASALAALLLGLAAAASPAGALTSRAEAFRAAESPSPRGLPPVPSWIVGGTRTSVLAAPWQVDVWSEDSRGVLDCGGAILDATTVLTAAHCVEGTRPGASPRAGGLAVWAGTSTISSRNATADDRRALQERRVASARKHPRWRGRVSATGDLALLQLAEPLVLDGQRVAAIALAPAVPVPVGAPLAVPVDLTVTGFGITRGGGGTDGRLRALGVQVVDPDRCGDADNAIELCAAAPRGSACSGDSGGPVTAPGPVLVGIVSNGPASCPRGGANRYVNLLAPENRAFLEGAAPPVAPRRASRARFTAASQAPRVGSTITCDGGVYRGVEIQRTVISATGGTVLASADSQVAVATVPADVVGQRLRCRSYATSAGGVAVSNVARTARAVRGAR